MGEPNEEREEYSTGNSVVSANGLNAFIQVRYLIISLRPSQWLKNLFVFAALIFGGQLTALHSVVSATLGFVAFSCISSAVYLYNDLIDIERDRKHPVKSKRPLPAGLLSKNVATVAAIALAVGALVLSFELQVSFGVTVVLYIINNILYSQKLKHYVILDVFSIAGGFVLRVVGGALLIQVPISQWLILCTLLLSLFLGFSKRATELVSVTDGSKYTRSVLGHYSQRFLDQMMGIVTASTVMCYALYTISAQTVAKFGTRDLIYTVPFVLYGIFRYLYLSEKRGGGEDPAKTLLKDKSLLLDLFLWIIAASIIIYAKV